jgi:hypothetical protein
MDFEAVKHRADLRAAAMHHHRVDADGLEHDDIAREGLGGAFVAHGVAAIFDDERVPSKTLDVGQRFAHRFGGAQQQFFGFDRLDFHGAKLFLPMPQ